MVCITDVVCDSHAARAGLKSGDSLLSINGREINDVLDYRFYLADTEIHLAYLRDGETKEAVILKSESEDIGLLFERPLMDKKHACENKCIFCFIDQLPKGMRKTLYFKDDDSRLSFLHGNYITLTNLKERDIKRIIEMRISPVNISVHTTNPSLRVEMMKNKRAGEVLSYLKRLSDAGISLCTQIVLCRGINDGEELMRTMKDLSELSPSLVSCSVVPAGLTKFREGLAPLSAFSKEEAGRVIDMVEAFSGKCLEKYGSRIFFCGDELYLKAERALPENDFYEGYPQLENGVGMLTSFSTDFEYDFESIDAYAADFADKYPDGREISIATGLAALDCISRITDKLTCAVPCFKAHVYGIENRFFGKSITVSGLLTGKDMREQLEGRELGEVLFIPPNSLKSDEDIFLDDITPKELSASLGVRVEKSTDNGGELIPILLGLFPDTK